jgi:excisionase family DNA binding protein
MSFKKVELGTNQYEVNLEQPFYSMKQLADIFAVNRSTISRLLRDGELPYFLVRGTKRIARRDIARFIDRQIAKNGSQESSTKEDGQWQQF